LFIEYRKKVSVKSIFHTEDQVVISSHKKGVTWLLFPLQTDLKRIPRAEADKTRPQNTTHWESCSYKELSDTQQFHTKGTTLVTSNDSPQFPQHPPFLSNSLKHLTKQGLLQHNHCWGV